MEKEKNEKYISRREGTFWGVSAYKRYDTNQQNLKKKGVQYEH